MFTQRVLDLPKLDTEAPNLDLEVDAAKELEQPAPRPPGEVAGAVHARAAWPAKGSGMSVPRSARGPVQIHATNPLPAYEQLARHADRHRLEIPVEDVNQQLATGRPIVARSGASALKLSSESTAHSVGPYIL